MEVQSHITYCATSQDSLCIPINTQATIVRKLCIVSKTCILSCIYVFVWQFPGSVQYSEIQVRYSADVAENNYSARGERLLLGVLLVCIAIYSEISIRSRSVRFSGYVFFFLANTMYFHTQCIFVGLIMVTFPHEIG